VSSASAAPRAKSSFPPATREVAASLTELRARRARHPFWSNRLFAALTSGSLTREDLRYVFSQYSLYSRSFTRYLAALMANCDDDLFRSRISENLWEEGGGCEPEKRHAELFRNFLRDGMGVDPAAIAFEDYTRHFVREYLDYCMRGSAIEASAFLSLGTEGIVAQVYETFVEGLHKAGLKDDELSFFYTHMACDDAHALTLESLLTSYAEEEGWFETADRAVTRALDLRMSFFENMFERIQQRRVRSILEKIQSRQSLLPERTAEVNLLHRREERGTALYSNEIPKHDIQFSVDRLPIGGEVLDARMVRIPPGKNNEKHRHAHETVFYIVEGSGLVRVGDGAIEVRAGDVVFVPRWALHQSQNRGTTEMTILAITDFGLTGAAFVGDYDKTARNKNDGGSS
jgi:pyrroloquinoline quinone (PQQ) biosynthesis protein C/quercetin dioxygenase-like cupin family protein